MRRLALLLLLLTAGCDAVSPSAVDRPDTSYTSKDFPKPHRPVAPVVSSRFSTEAARDDLNEANIVMDRAGIVPGMTVADIGAGEGYYTIRLATRVGAAGRVLAQDIIPAVRDKLAERVSRERLDNVSVKLGTPEDPKLPVKSFDRIFMVHMYHEIGSPYEFIWRMRPSLKHDGRVIVVDMERPAGTHGIPQALLKCEFEAVGYRQVEARPMPLQDEFYSVFEPAGGRPAPDRIKPCTVPDATSDKAKGAH